jgi:hypothetical protein
LEPRTRTTTKAEPNAVPRQRRSNAGRKNQRRSLDPGLAAWRRARARTEAGAEAFSRAGAARSGAESPVVEGVSADTSVFADESDSAGLPPEPGSGRCSAGAVATRCKDRDAIESAAAPLPFFAAAGRGLDALSGADDCSPIAGFAFA